MSEKLKVRLQFVKAKNFNDIIHKVAEKKIVNVPTCAWQFCFKASYVLTQIANNQADFGASQPNMNVGRYKLADIAYPMFERYAPKKNVNTTNLADTHDMTQHMKHSSFRIFYFKNRKPGPVDSFKTLSYPFEAVTWIWIAAAMAAGVLAFTTLSLTKLRPFVKGWNVDEMFYSLDLKVVNPCHPFLT